MDRAWDEDAAWIYTCRFVRRFMPFSCGRKAFYIFRGNICRAFFFIRNFFVNKGWKHGHTPWHFTLEEPDKNEIYYFYH
jgi:hypothetical protein